MRTLPDSTGMNAEGTPPAEIPAPETNETPLSMRLRKWVLPVLIVLMVEEWSSGLRDALCIGAALWLLLAPPKSPIPVRPSPALTLLLGWALWSALSVLWADHPHLAWRDALKFAPVIAGTWSISRLVQRRTDAEYMLFWIGIGLTLVFMVDALTWLAGVGTQWNLFTRWETPRAFQHPNTYSGLIVASLPIALLRLHLPDEPRWSKAMGVLQIVTSAILLWTFASRTAQIALVITSLFALMLMFGRRSLPAAALLLALAVGSAPWLNPRFNDPSMSNLSDRFDVWERTSDLVLERPLLGHGFGTRNFTTTLYARFPNRTTDFKHPHDLPLELVFSTGLVGLALFTGAWVAVATRLAHLHRHGAGFDRSLATALLSSLCALLVFSLADYPRGPLWIFLWVIFGIATGITRTARSDSTQRISG